MSNDLVPYTPSSSSLESYRSNFKVPHDWQSCGPAVYISGAPKVRDSQPVAVALTKETISLCGSDGPIWSLHLLSIKDVKTTNLTGLSFPIKTPAGDTHMVPLLAYGVEVNFNLTHSGAVGRIVWCTMSRQSANDWVNDITDAMYILTYGPSDVDQQEVQP